MPQGQKGFTIFMDFAKMKNTVVFKKNLWQAYQNAY